MANPPTNRRPGVDADIFQGQWVRGFDVPAGNNDPAADPCDLIVSNGKSQIDQTVSNLIFANRKDDVNQPIFVMAQGETATAPIGTVNFHIGREEDPNGLVTTSTSGSLYASYGTPGLWQLQADNVTWVKISDDLGGEDLQQTLAIGNETGGFSIVLSSGDALKGLDNSVGDAFPAKIVGGDATGALGDGGDVILQGGATVGGTTGAIGIETPTAVGTGGSGQIAVRTGESKLGGSSGSVVIAAGEAGDAGVAGNGGSVFLSAGRSLSTVGTPFGGRMQLTAGQATSDGRGGELYLAAGSSSNFSILPPLVVLTPGQGGGVTLRAGSSSQAEPGGTVGIFAGTGGSSGAVGGNINLTPGAGGGGFDDGEVVANGIFRADNIKRGNGDPNVGGVPGNEGDVYQRLDLGLGQIWLNTNGSPTGWVQLAQTGDFIEAFEQMSWGWVGPAGTNTSGTEAGSYHDVGIWHGLRPNNASVGGGGGTISRGAALNDGPVLSFVVDNTFVGNQAALDLSTGGGNLPHAREHGPIITMRVKNTRTSNHRIFIGLTTETATNQLGADFPAGAAQYMGFLLSPAFGTWRTVTRDGLGTSSLDTGIATSSTQLSSDAFWFIIDASDTTTPTVRYFILDAGLNLVSVIEEIASLPTGSTRLGLVVGLRSTAIQAVTNTLYLDHAAIVNQGALVGQSGGTGIGGLSLNQVLNNGNTTGTTLIEINQGSGLLGVTDDNAGDGAGFGIFGGATTLATNDTGGVTVSSGNAFGGGAENPGSTTGDALFITGSQFGVTSQGDTGTVLLASGSSLGTDGTTGGITIATGFFTNGGAGTRTQGDILIGPGTFAPNPATVTGEVIIKGGSSSLSGVTGGDVTITSGENSSGSGDTGDIIVETFPVNTAGDSGGLELKTGDGGAVSGDSGNIDIETGAGIGAGDTGAVAITTGAAASGTAGQILVRVGDSTSGDGSTLTLQAGLTTAGGQVGGSVILNPGTGPAGDGEVLINGKLTVTGLIDPTGLLLDGQLAAPATTAAGEGLLWIDSTAVPSRIIFTDDTGTDHDISTGGGATTLGALTDVSLAAPAAGEVLTYNGAQWVNLAGAGGSPLSTILGLGNTTGGTAGGIVVTGTAGDRIASDDDLILDPAAAAGSAVVIDGLRWPETDGANGFVLTTNGLGQLSWQPGGGGGSGNGFAEAFAQMQWGSLTPPPDLGFASTLNGSGILHDHADTAPGGQSVLPRADGLAVQMVGIGGNVAEAGFISTNSITRPDNLGIYIWKFEMSNTLGVRLFLGLTDGTRFDMVNSDAPVTPVNGFIGLGYSTTVPDAGFVFFHNNGPGAGVRIATGVGADTAAHYFAIDATVPGQFTLTLYDNTFTQQAQSVINATIPAATDVLRIMGALMPNLAPNEALFLYSCSVVHRADLLGAVGGGGNQDLASVLGFGNMTGGLAIQGDDNVGGAGGTLALRGGDSTGGGGAGGLIDIRTGLPDPGGNGNGGDIQITAATGAGLGDGGGFQLVSGDGGPLGGDGGIFRADLGSGPGAASGNGGSAVFNLGDGGATGGAGGSFGVTCGDALAGNDAGGRAFLRGGTGNGTGGGGLVELTGGDGGANGDGGDILISVGAGNGAGVDGVITMTGDTTITGKLTVTGLIDPTGLLLDSQAVVPFTPIGSDGGIWVNNSGELIYTNALGDLNLSTAIGGGMSWLDALLTAGYGFLGAGNPLGGGPQSYGVFGGSSNLYESPGPPPAAATFGQDSEGPFMNLAVAATAASQVYLGTSDLQIQRDSQFKSRIKFQVTSPAHTDERIFIGFTDDATFASASPMLATDPPIVGAQYMGLSQSLAGFNLEFVARGSGGSMVNVFAIPTDALVHYLEIDTTVTTEVTFNLYAADGTTLEATHTEPAGGFLVPDAANPLRPFVGIFTGVGTTPRSLDFYEATVVTRADVVDAVTGGGMGGTPDLAMVLAAGNDAGGTAILADGGITGNTGGLALAGGFAGGGGNPALIQLAPDIGDNGGEATIFGGAGGGAAGLGGRVRLQAGEADAGGSGDGGEIRLSSGNGGGTGGDAGDINIFGGDAQAANGAGGSFVVNAGNSFGTTVGGAISLTAGIGGVGPGTGDGGRVLLQAGSPGGTGSEGGVDIFAGAATAFFTGEGAVQLVGSPEAGAALTSAYLYIDRATASQGGSIVMEGGDAPVGSGGDGGSFVFVGGPRDGGGDHGHIYLTGDGASTIPSINPGGDIQLVGATVAGFSTGATLVVDGGGTLIPGSLQGLAGGGEPGSGLGGAPVAFIGGAGDGPGAGGGAQIRGGDGGATGDGGDGSVRGGNATGGANAGGDVRLIPGTGPAASGRVQIEGKIDPAVGGGVAGVQYGVSPGLPAGAGPHTVSFNVAFGSPPTTIQFNIEGAAPIAGQDIMIVPGTITTTSFDILASAPFAGGERVHWVAYW